jgi:glutamate racemase
MRILKMVLFLLILIHSSGYAQSPDSRHSVATFDSGFGGYFTAKEIEKRAKELETKGYGGFSIQHFGDTLNAPYGDKTPEQIAHFSAVGILSAFRHGASDVFLACNTASTQYDAIRNILRKYDASYPNRVHSIIDVSVKEIMKTVSKQLKRQDVVSVSILATPATVRSENYPRFLAKSLNARMMPTQVKSYMQARWRGEVQHPIESLLTRTELELGPKKRVVVYQIAPANWVEMIEHGASDEEKRAAVEHDLTALLGLIEEPIAFEVVGEFCTHYPVFDSLIQQTFKQLNRTSQGAPFIVQGPLMGALFERNFTARHRPTKSLSTESRTTNPTIFISGDNQDATRALAKTVFPNDPVPEVLKLDFNASVPVEPQSKTKSALIIGGQQKNQLRKPTWKIQ